MIRVHALLSDDVEPCHLVAAADPNHWMTHGEDSGALRHPYAVQLRTLEDSSLNKKFVKRASDGSTRSSIEILDRIELVVRCALFVLCLFVIVAHCAMF
ncbi:hypothetical protein TKK_0011381 [Trichogramma kaykai]